MICVTVRRARMPDVRDGGAEHCVMPPPDAQREMMMTPIENAEVARILREAADLLELENANPFRVRAYRNAARTVEELAEPVAAMAREGTEPIDALPGIGADLAGKIVEIVKTGTFPLLEDLEKHLPEGTVELMHVPGIGPKHARALAEQLHVTSIAKLEKAARGGKLHELPGFGERTEQKILREIEAHREEEHRLLRPAAAEYGESYVNYLRGFEDVERIEIAGSYRRCRETVGDLDILAASTHPGAVIEHFVTFSEVTEIIARGTTKASVRLRSGLQVDLRVLAPESFGAALHYFTGSKAHNIAVRKMGQTLGLKINEYGIYRGTKRIGGETEQEVFEAVGLPWIPPELREDRGEIEAARAGRLPGLVELADIRGDLQSHSTDSDGRDTIEAMAQAAEALGYEYLALTDHTPSVRIAGGLDARGFREQMKRIDRLNGTLKKLRVLKGAEVDILPDGSLDLDDDTLDELDIVVVAMHAGLGLSKREQTRRIVRALGHRSVDVFGHPTGRLLGRRRGASFDFDEVLRAALGNGVLLEVNAQPERLDLDDISCRAAIEKGATIVISTDAHSVSNLRLMRWGVDQARRGWASKRDVANTRPLEQLLKLLHRSRR
jgi:DNA polymerase (family 10)